MTFQGTYIGYGIETTIKELVNIFKNEKAGIKQITDGFNSYDDDFIVDIYESLYNCARNNKIYGLDLCVVQQPHDAKNKVYFGDFVLVSDDFESVKIHSNNECEKLKNILTDSEFKKLCLTEFNKHAELISISVGCFCCT